MPRYKILIEYDGTRYSGWQKQPNASTVEENIESAFSQILQEPIDVIGQGRTDSGVHAEGQVAHLDSPVELDRHKLLFALLGVLPKDIAVWDLQETAPDFHARFDATARQYRYQIITRPSPLWNNFSEMILDELDVEKMRACSTMLRGTHDFESFTYSSDEQPGTECQVILSEFSFTKPVITYRIKANRFIRHMVRRLVGSMIQVGRGKLTLDEFSDMLRHPNKDKSGHGAPAKGLILEEVEYSDLKKDANLP